MAEQTYPTIGHGQINCFIFPIKATASWNGLTTVATQFAQAQVNRLTSLGLGAFDLALRKRYEVGRTAATEKVASSAIDKPATLEWLDHGSLRIWNLLTGRAYDSASDITQARFDATLAECCIVVHKLDESSPANVIESDVLWRCVVDTVGISIPNSQDDDVRVSVRLTGDEHVMATNAAGKAVMFHGTAGASGVVTMAAATIGTGYGTPVERDDWSDDDDGTNERTVVTANPGVGVTSLTVYDETGFSAGQDIIVRTSPTSWETTTVASTSADTVVTNDAVDVGGAWVHDVGTEVARTRGHALFVYNQTTGAYLELGTDYREQQTAAATFLIVPVDGGSAISLNDEIWACWLVASGQEIWTDNDNDLYGVTHPMTKLMVSPEAAFVTSTVGYVGIEVTEDTDFDFSSSGSLTSDEWAGYWFTAAATGKIDNIQAYMYRSGNSSIAGEVYAELYTSAGGSGETPTTRIGNPSVPVLASSMGSETLAQQTFYFTDGPDITSATTYFVVFKTKGYTEAAATAITWRIDADGGDSSLNRILTADPNVGGAGVPGWGDHTQATSGAQVDVNLVGSQEVKRIQGMDMSITFSRSAFYEMGSESTIERSFDETDVRITIPKMMSDNTTWSRAIDKNTTSVKTSRPEQNPVVWMRLEEYSTVAKNAGDIQLTYEFPQVQRSGGEKTSPANERSTERITMTGDTFTIADEL